MIFWIAIALLTAITLFLLAAPLWRKPKAEGIRAEYDLNVFKDQLKELERDVERGMISESEAETARIEVQRRLLGADEARKADHATAQGLSKTSIVVSGFVAIGIILGSLALYAKLGQPGYPDMPYASRDIENERQQVDTKGMAEGIVLLKKRLETDPTDIDSWVLLGRTLRTVGRVEEALDAYRGALKYSDRHPDILADFAEAKIYVNQGEVDAETVDSLKDSLQQDPAQMKALFYMGYAQLRKEDFKGSIQTWTDLLAIAPKTAVWIPQVQEQIAIAAKAGGLDSADFKPSAQARVLAKQLKLEWESQTPAQPQESTAPGPSSEDVKNAAEMSDEDRQSMIKTMVDRLAAKLKENPDDLAGWKRLLRAYQVMGDTANAAMVETKIKELEAR
jgi:cytochrome c-type biogenesis protein CcmH